MKEDIVNIPPIYLTVKQVSQILGVRPETLWTWRKKKDGNGLPWHKRGRSIRYMKTEVERFIEKNSF